jgi:hypothetical protein
VAFVASVVLERAGRADPDGGAGAGSPESSKRSCSCLTNGKTEVDPAIRPEELLGIQELLATLERLQPTISIRLQKRGKQRLFHIRTGDGCCTPDGVGSFGSKITIVRGPKGWRVVKHQRWAIEVLD